MIDLESIRQSCLIAPFHICHLWRNEIAIAEMQSMSAFDSPITANVILRLTSNEKSESLPLWTVEDLASFT